MVKQSELRHPTLRDSTQGQKACKVCSEYARCVAGSRLTHTELKFRSVRRSSSIAEPFERNAVRRPQSLVLEWRTSKGTALHILCVDPLLMAVGWVPLENVPVVRWCKCLVASRSKATWSIRSARELVRAMSCDMKASACCHCAYPLCACSCRTAGKPPRSHGFQLLHVKPESACLKNDRIRMNDINFILTYSKWSLRHAMPVGSPPV